MPNNGQFKYSDTLYSLEDFANLYGQQLPVIIIVVEGFMGVDEQHTITSNEAFRIMKLQSQSRVVCRDHVGRRLSIPKDYHCNFQVVHGKGKGGKPGSLEKVISDWSAHFPLTSLKFQLQDDSRVHFSYAGDRQSFSSFGVLQYEDTYDEVYLVGFTILNDEICVQPSLLPTYLTTKVGVVKGMVTDSYDVFPKYLHCPIPDLERRLAVVQSNQEIIVLPKYTDDAGIYSSLIPSNYVYSYNVSKREVKDEGSSRKINLQSDDSLYENFLGEKVQFIKVTDYQFKDDELHVTANTTTKTERLKVTFAGDSHNYSALVPGTANGKRKSKKPPPLKPKPSFSKLQDNKAIKGDLYEEISTCSGDEANSCTSSAARRFSCVAEVPDDLSLLSASAVTECLQMLEMSEYIAVFQKNQVDGDLLTNLDEEILIKDFKFKKFAARKLIRFIAGWRPMMDDH